LLTIKSRIILIAVSLLTSLALTLMTNYDMIYAQSPDTTTRLVHAGEGNATNVVMQFVPQKIEINSGQSVTWNNPTSVPEPHSVTFIKDNKYFPPPAVPFSVTNSTNLKPLATDANIDPLIIPDSNRNGTITVVIDNARNYNPVSIDSTGKNVTYLPPNANYTLDGTEKYVNSGWIWPEGQAPPGAPPISKFTVTFENPGTYSYLCTLHPWMAGTVTVK
jgi:plastocyanin